MKDVRLFKHCTIFKYSLDSQSQAIYYLSNVSLIFASKLTAYQAKMPVMRENLPFDRSSPFLCCPTHPPSSCSLLLWAGPCLSMCPRAHVGAPGTLLGLLFLHPPESVPDIPTHTSLSVQAGALL